MGGVVVVTAGLVAASIAVWRTEPQDPGEKVAQPHRAAVALPRPAAGQPRWAVPDHHWTALSKTWTTVSSGSGDFTGLRLVSDGKRAIAYEAGRLTAYDGATGKRIWWRALAWDGSYEPVAGDGIVIVPLHDSDSRFSDCVAFDSATGAQRWREPLCPGSSPADGPVGALSHGVFYYTAGRTVTGVDAATGERRYQRRFLHDLGLSTPVVANGRIVLSGSWWSPNRSTPGKSGIHLLSPDLKTDQDIPLSGDSDGEHVTMPDLPAVSGDVVLVRSGNAIRPVDTRTGRKPSLRWTTPQGNVVGVSGRTVVTAMTVYAGRRRVSGYDLLTGARVWSREIERKSFSYDIEDGTLFALGDGVAIIDSTTGKTVFQRPAARHDGNDIARQGRAVSAGGHIVVFDDKGGITGYH